MCEGSDTNYVIWHCQRSSLRLTSALSKFKFEKDDDMLFSHLLEFTTTAKPAANGLENVAV
jgi:hypothetical protein